MNDSNSFPSFSPFLFPSLPFFLLSFLLFFLLPPSLFPPTFPIPSFFPPSSLSVLPLSLPPFTQYHVAYMGILSIFIILPLTDLPVLAQVIATVFAHINIFIIIPSNFYDAFLLFYTKLYGMQNAR